MKIYFDDIPWWEYSREICIYPYINDMSTDKYEFSWTWTLNLDGLIITTADPYLRYALVEDGIKMWKADAEEDKFEFEIEDKALKVKFDGKEIASVRAHKPLVSWKVKNKFPIIHIKPIYKEDVVKLEIE